MDNMIHVATNRQVFIDKRFVQIERGVSLTTHAPHVADEVCITQEYSWECFTLGYFSVVRADGFFHMWYSAFGVDVEEGCEVQREEYYQKPTNQPGSREGMIRGLCYARSVDGKCWEKPMLNMTTELKNNNNNIVCGYGASGVSGSMKGGVSYDPDAPEQERYIMIGSAGGDVAGLPGQDSGLIVWCSGDGINWKSKAGNAVTDSERRNLDTLNLLFRDDRINKYVAYLRKNPNPSGFEQFRTVARAESERIDGFPDVKDCQIVMAADRLDPSEYNPEFGHNVPIIDYYTPSVVKYPWAEDAYYAFPSVYFKYSSWFLHEYEDGAPVNAGPVDVRFRASRDGIRWESYDRRAFVRLGRKNAPDSGTIYMGWGIVDGGNGNLFMYCETCDGIHGYNRNKENNELIVAGGHGPAGDNSVHECRRLVLRRDGFVSIRGDYTGGCFTTPLLTSSGSSLELNVDTSALGQVQVELQDEYGRFIDGYSLEDCDMIHTCNEISRTVTWRGKSDTSPATCRPFKMHVKIRDADLYAFQFCE